VTLSPGSADRMAGVMSIWRGCVQLGDPFEGLATAHGSSSSMNGTGLVTSGPNRRAATFYAISNVGEVSTSDPDAGWTEVFDYDGTGFNAQGQAASAQAVPIAASVGAETRVLGGSCLWASFSLAFVPGT